MCISNRFDWCYSIVPLHIHWCMARVLLLHVCILYVLTHTHTLQCCVCSSSFHMIWLTFLRHGYDCWYYATLFIPSSICLIFSIRFCCCEFFSLCFHFIGKWAREHNQQTNICCSFFAHFEVAVDFIIHRNCLASRKVIQNKNICTTNRQPRSRNENIFCTYLWWMHDTKPNASDKTRTKWQMAKCE